MATVAQTFADVVEVHGGEPAPQDGEPEPVEPLPVSQRSDYESDEWYTPQGSTSMQRRRSWAASTWTRPAASWRRRW